MVISRKSTSEFEAAYFLYRTPTISDPDYNGQFLRNGGLLSRHRAFVAPTLLSPAWSFGPGPPRPNATRYVLSTLPCRNNVRVWASFSTRMRSTGPVTVPCDCLKGYEGEHDYDGASRSRSCPEKSPSACAEFHRITLSFRSLPPCH
jgi:hypothetical protein